MSPATTHDLTFAGQTVTKRYRRWHDGEPRREWDALTLMHRHAPDLVPAPLTRQLDADPPLIVMSRLPGEPVGTRTPATDVCLDAVAHALDTFHHAVPSAELATRALRRWPAARILTEVRSWALETVGTPPDTPYPADARRALAAGATWITTSGVRRLEPSEPRRVFGRGDGNVANLLWDRERVRLVDFEDAGVSDEAFELADLAEHPSTWVDGAVDADKLLEKFTLIAYERARIREYRRLFGLFWLLMLLPGNPASGRNPAGTLQRQVVRFSTLLGTC